jgi:hypothetical protein
VSNESGSTEDSNGPKLANVGILGTKLYVILLLAALPSMAYLGWIKISVLELNQIGDFLAGLFGPLAIFWIVLGFFQQGEELRNSVDTLKLQAKELAASVEQQRELVQVTREQLAHEREMLGIQRLERKKMAQADFIIEFRKVIGFGDNSGKYRCKIINTGNHVSRVEFQIRDDNQVIARRTWPYCSKGWEEDSIDAFGGAQVPMITSQLAASISYVDELNEVWEVTYVLFPPTDTTGFGIFLVDLKEVLQLPKGV